MRWRKIIIIFILSGIFLGLFIRYQHRAPKRNFCDYRVYYATGKRILQGQDIYSRPNEEITPFKYSPIFALFMVPLSIFDEKTSANLFFILNILFIFLMFELSKRLIFLKLLNFNQNFLIYFLTSILNLRFLLYTLDTGQVSIFMLTLLILGLYLISKKHELAGSFFIGGSVMIKYTPALFIPYFFLKKKYKLTIFIILVILFYSFLPTLFIGVEKNLFYLTKWFPFIFKTSLDKGSFLDYKNQSLLSMIARILSEDSQCGIKLAKFNFTTALLITSIFCILLYTFIILPINKRMLKPQLNRFYDCIDYGLLFICISLFNPNAWMHNFVSLFFPYMLIIYYLIIRKFKDKITIFFVLISFIFCSLGSESLVGNKLENLFETYSVVTFGALFLFIALVKIKFGKNLITNYYE